MENITKIQSGFTISDKEYVFTGDATIIDNNSAHIVTDRGIIYVNTSATVGNQRFANINALLTSADLPAGGPSSAAASICGRVPVWQPADYASHEAHLGVCLWLWANGTWAVVDAELEKAQDLTLASGTLSRGSVLDSWHSLSLSFINEQVTASIDEIIVAANISGMRRSSGGYGLGTLWHVAYFDDIFFNTTLPYLGGSSFLFDILPGEAIVNNVTQNSSLVRNTCQELGNRYPLLVTIDHRNQEE
jgi:hypothetical protein